MAAELIMVSLVAFITGCDRNTPANKSRGVIVNRLDVIWSCKSADDLRNFYAKRSLGDNVRIKTEDRLVFVQTFPYSGVRASHLIVYALDDDDMRFVVFLNVPTQENVVLNRIKHGSIEVRANEKTIVTLEQSQ